MNIENENILENIIASKQVELAKTKNCLTSFKENISCDTQNKNRCFLKEITIQCKKIT